MGALGTGDIFVTPVAVFMAHIFTCHVPSHQGHMSYLFIKKNDVKMFKSFLSGKEIEVSILVSSSASVFGTGDDVEIFYGNENCDSYKAQITRQIRKSLTIGNADQSVIVLCLVKK